MGFSVSGSAVVLFLGVFISFGMAYTAANNGFEQVHDALNDETDADLARQNTGVSIADVSVANEGDGPVLTVTANNTGTTALSVNDTDILIDGQYSNFTGESMTTSAVDGNDRTDLWLPGETLRVEVPVASEPSQVKVVTETGVADSEVV
ncbi:fla cluster protein FlaF [Halorussus halobius]|uniref:fla cluster protein FlaF n=1 Tax=Halorussus halobius TaxID=1710537 RepID=UPI001092F4D1|nr:fla cluster protein FlaF [Halorussus halobius]